MSFNDSNLSVCKLLTSAVYSVCKYTRFFGSKYRTPVISVQFSPREIKLFSCDLHQTRNYHTVTRIFHPVSPEGTCECSTSITMLGK